MNQKKTTVTLEDLLRLKRAERPPAEFWDQFDRDLRLKQMAAIVEPRPWWAPLIKFGAQVSRYQLPVGAAAILALSCVTVREYRTANFAQPEFALPQSSAVSEPAPSMATAQREVAVATAARATYAVSTPAKPVVPESVTNVGERPHSAPLPSLTARLNSEPNSPSTRAMAANLAAVQASDPRLMDDVLGGTGRVTEAREPVSDPLAQISAPGESRRSRLLSSALSSASAVPVSVGTSARVARHLTEERLYDRVSRLDGDANRLVIKF